MDKEYISGKEGVNYRFKRETLLNYAMNRWGLNKAHSVGATSELIRTCAPKTYSDWEQFYFDKAYQKKKDGLKITREYIIELGKSLYIKLSETVQKELSSITEEECIEYAYNLVLSRTYEGYRTEIETVYGQLEGMLNVNMEPAPDKWDRLYSVDFYIKVNDKYIGIQIKPISSERSINQYQWIELNKSNHAKFEKDHGGKVFFIYSTKTSSGKKIYNTEVIGEIQSEIDRIKNGRE